MYPGGVASTPTYPQPNATQPESLKTMDVNQFRKLLGSKLYNSATCNSNLEDFGQEPDFSSVFLLALLRSASVSMGGGHLVTVSRRGLFVVRCCKRL